MLESKEITIPKNKISKVHWNKSNFEKEVEFSGDIEKGICLGETVFEDGYKVVAFFINGANKGANWVELRLYEPKYLNKHTGFKWYEHEDFCCQDRIDFNNNIFELFANSNKYSVTLRKQA